MKLFASMISSFPRSKRDSLRVLQVHGIVWIRGMMKESIIDSLSARKRFTHFRAASSSFAVTRPHQQKLCFAKRSKYGISTTYCMYAG